MIGTHSLACPSYQFSKIIKWLRENKLYYGPGIILLGLFLALLGNKYRKYTTTLIIGFTLAIVLFVIAYQFFVPGSSSGWSGWVTLGKHERTKRGIPLLFFLISFRYLRYSNPFSVGVASCGTDVRSRHRYAHRKVYLPRNGTHWSLAWCCHSQSLAKFPSLQA